MSLKIKKKFTSAFLNNDKEEDFRKSLMPISDTKKDIKFTKFVKFKDRSTKKLIGSEHGQPPTPISRPNFRSDRHVATDTQLTGQQLYLRYRDNSYIFPDNKATPRNNFIQKWSKLYSYMVADDQNGNTKTIPKDSYVLLVWNFVVMISYIFNIYEVPVALFFTSAVYYAQTTTVVGLLLNWTFVALIIVNIAIVRPNTQYQKLGYLIQNRTQIIDSYFGFNFFMDLFGLIILIIYLAAGVPDLIYLKLFFYFNLVTINAIDNMITHKLQFHLYSHAAYRLIKLQSVIIFIVLWLSAIFFAIDYYFYVNGGPYTGSANWLTSEPCTTGITPTGEIFNLDIIQHYPWYIWLNYAAYWCLQTISTVGYGDFTPRNPASVAYTNVVILMVVFFFVLFINSVIEIIDEMTSAQHKQRKANLKMFKQYYLEAQRKRNQISIRFKVDDETVKKNKKQAQITGDNIRSYLYEMDLHNLLNQDDNVQKLVYNNLPQALRQELFLNYRQQFFKKIRLFGQVAQNSAKFFQVYEELIYKIKDVAYGSEEMVFHEYQKHMPNPPIHSRNITYANKEMIAAQNKKKSNRLYFLLKGSVKLKYPYCYSKTHDNSQTERYQKILENINDKKEAAEGQGVPEQFLNFGVREFFNRQPRLYYAVTLTYCQIQILDYEDFIEILKNYPSFYYKYCELRDLLTIQGLQSLTGQSCFSKECKSEDHHLMACGKCRWNISLLIRKQQRPNHGYGLSNGKNRRVPSYFRDPVKCKKINYFTKPYIPADLFSEVKNIQEYFPSKNLSDSIAPQ